MFDRLFNRRAFFGDLDFRIDSHSHLLPGVDDGVQNPKDSLAILKAMVGAGIKEVVLTPHINPDVFPDNSEQRIRNSYSDFISSVPSEISSSIDISLGGEYMVTGGFEKRNPGELLQFRDGKVLIEMSYYYISNNMEDAIFNLTMAGLQPVIAHPERYLYLADKLSIFDRYHDMGAEFQLNLLSLSGAYGPASIEIMKYILKRGWYAFRGTDTHTVAHFRTICNIEFPRELLRDVSSIGMERE